MYAKKYLPYTEFMQNHSHIKKWKEGFKIVKTKKILDQI